MQPAPTLDPVTDDKRIVSKMWMRWFQLVQTALNATITQTVRITFADSPYTIPDAGVNLICDTDDGAISVTYPLGSQNAVVRVCNVGSSGNNLTVDGNGTERIYGNLTKVLASGIVLETRFDITEGWW